MTPPKRPVAFYGLAVFFGLYVLFLYGPMLPMFILSFQGPDGEPTFPMRGFGFNWIAAVFQEQRVGSFIEPFQRSLVLSLTIMGLSMMISVMAGLAFRQRFLGSRWLFYLTLASLIVPSILISLGIGIIFNILDWPTQWYTSALGGQLTWTLPFTFLIVIGIFNRFNRSFEEAAKDLGANDQTTFWQIIFPLIGPGLVGVAVFGFTLSYDEFTRTSLISGEHNTLPLEIFGMTTNVTTPAIYALGTLTTLFSFGMIALGLAAYQFFSRRGQA